MAKAIGEAGEKVLREVTTAWIRIPSGSGTNESAIRLLQGDLRSVTALVAILSLIVAATKMAMSRRGEDMRDAALALFRMAVVGACGVFVLGLVLSAGDEFSTWILDRSTGGGLSGGTLTLVASSIGDGLIFVLGFLAILTGIIQIALLVVRSALIVVLAGTWQVAAAASTTPAGAQMWKKTTGWLLAFVLYKPVAAVCYAASFRLTQGQGSSGGDQLLAAVEGVLLMVLAVLALPAMLRLVVPASAAIGGASTAGVLAAGAAVATGAVALAAGPAGAAAAAGGSGAGQLGGGFEGGGAGGSPLPTGGGQPGGDSGGGFGSAAGGGSGSRPEADAGEAGAVGAGGPGHAGGTARSGQSPAGASSGGGGEPAADAPAASGAAAPSGTEVGGLGAATGPAAGRAAPSGAWASGARAVEQGIESIVEGEVE